jgi:hypothetical protein
VLLPRAKPNIAVSALKGAFRQSKARPAKAGRALEPLRQNDAYVEYLNSGIDFNSSLVALYIA